MSGIVVNHIKKRTANQCTFPGSASVLLLLLSVLLSSLRPRISLTVCSTDSSLSARRFVRRREKAPAPRVEITVMNSLRAKDFHIGNCELVFVSQLTSVQHFPLFSSCSPVVCVPLEVSDTVPIKSMMLASVSSVPIVHPNAL